jgi:hypothetical protein
MVRGAKEGALVTRRLLEIEFGGQNQIVGMAQDM